MRPSLPTLALLLFLPLLPPCSALPQQAPASSEPAWLLSLTPEQRAQFDQARQRFAAGDFAGALPGLRSLHDQAPQNEVITKFTAEAAVNAGDFALASSLLEPIVQADPDDAQALAIEAHIYGQQHDITRRDAVMARIQKLHDEGKATPSSVIIEKDPLPGGGFVRIDDDVQPWSGYHIVLMASFYNADGQRTRRMTLESDDIDQLEFAKQHPAEAAAGVRIYSMDTYAETRDAQGQVTGQIHGTLCPVPGCFMTAGLHTSSSAR